MNFSRKIFLTLLLIASLFLASSCKNKKSERLDLFNSIFFTDAAPEATLDEIKERKDFTKMTAASSNNLQKLLKDEKNYLWLKIPFALSDGLKNKDLGLYIGYLRSANEIWLNDFPIGKSGAFPPKEFSSGFKAHYYSFPNEILNQDEENILYIKVWPGFLSGISQKFYITESETAYLNSENTSFTNSKINMIFTGAMWLVFIFYMIMHFTLRNINHTKEFIIFAMLNCFTIAYLTPFAAAEMPWLQNYGFSYLTFIKLTLLCGAYITVFFANSFILELLGEHESKMLLQIRIVLLLIPILITLFVRKYSSLNVIITISVFLCAGQFGFTIPRIISAVLQKDKQPRVIKLLIGFAPVILCVIVDFFIRIIFKNTTLPFFTLYGWQVTIIVFLCYLAIQFNTTYSRNIMLKDKLEEFNNNLEEIVNLRTKELSDANFVLTRGLEAVANVQQNFLPSKTKFLKGWDISISYNPLSDNVSGDLYDYYSSKDKLDGLGIFDVSGHGIPAGLMTILAKGIINQHFSQGLEKNSSVEEIMANINESYIKEKVNVENYITGILFKFGKVDSKQKCTVELSNAGHPYPLFYTSENKDIVELKYKNLNEQYGMIGIEGLETSFPCVKISTMPNDIIVCFTDGLIEATNKNGEQFGTFRLTNIIQENASKSADEILSKILSVYENFTRASKREDDTTIIVLKRTDSSDFVEEI